MVLKIFNIEGHQNCIIVSQVTIFLSMINKGLFWLWNQSTVDNRGVSRVRSVAVGVSDRWKVICDMWKVTCDK